MSDFRMLGEGMMASPQITPGELSEAAGLGIRLVINNRPDGESDDQPSGTEIESAARALGMEYVAIPVTHAGIGPAQVDDMVSALSSAEGPVLAYCRSGTRSTLLWSLAQAKLGRDPQELADTAAAAGYDLSPIRPALDALSASAKN